MALDWLVKYSSFSTCRINLFFLDIICFHSLRLVRFYLKFLLYKKVNNLILSDAIIVHHHKLNTDQLASVINFTSPVWQTRPYGQHFNPVIGSESSKLSISSERRSYKPPCPNWTPTRPWPPLTMFFICVPLRRLSGANICHLPALSAASIHHPRIYNFHKSTIPRLHWRPMQRTLIADSCLALSLTLSWDSRLVLSSLSCLWWILEFSYGWMNETINYIQ